MAELSLDRTGYGKVNKNVNINVDFAAQLEAAINRSSRARAIEAPASPLAPQSGQPNVPILPDAPAGLPLRRRF
jgi:hypothetical protein